ncbi:MAG: glycosyltransferase, partial [Acetobacteraceae bacterium]|nr:glycosyltransferase [Acetobacteraceae bacterium]
MNAFSLRSHPHWPLSAEAVKNNVRTSLLPGVSAAIPTLNARRTLPPTLVALAGAVSEIVVADGGSTDGTPDLAASLGARVIEARRGRGPQLADAVSAARGDWLLLLHA